MALVIAIFWQKANARSRNGIVIHELAGLLNSIRLG
jgi:hypothetical protein